MGWFSADSTTQSTSQTTANNSDARIAATDKAKVQQYPFDHN